VSLKANNLAFENFINAFAVDEKIKNFDELSSSILGEYNNNNNELSIIEKKHFVDVSLTCDNSQVLKDWLESICEPCLDPRGKRQFQIPITCMS